MNTYEAVIIITTKISDEVREQTVNKIKELISSNGEVTAVDEWGTKKLAYEIKKEAEGQYYLLTFIAQPEFIAELERIIRIDDGILKHMVIKK